MLNKRMVRSLWFLSFIVLFIVCVKQLSPLRLRWFSEWSDGTRLRSKRQVHYTTNNKTCADNCDDTDIDGHKCNTDDGSREHCSPNPGVSTQGKECYNECKTYGNNYSECLIDCDNNQMHKCGLVVNPTSNTPTAAKTCTTTETMARPATTSSSNSIPKTTTSTTASSTQTTQGPEAPGPPSDSANFTATISSSNSTPQNTTSTTANSTQTTQGRKTTAPTSDSANFTPRSLLQSCLVSVVMVLNFLQ